MLLLNHYNITIYFIYIYVKHNDQNENEALNEL